MTFWSILRSLYPALAVVAIAVPTIWYFELQHRKGDR